MQADANATPVPREIRRKRLKNLLVHYQSHGSPAMREHLTRQLNEFPIGGILPKNAGPYLAHCGAWHAVEDVPFQTPCCGTWILIEDTDHA